MTISTDFMIIDGKKLVFADKAAHVVTISVADAVALLARNELNRSINKKNILKLTTDVQSGDFSFNGQAIVLSVDGRLLDGQHRLMVIVATGQPLMFTVSTGVETKAQRDMDSGDPRKLKDSLEMDKEPYFDTLASVLIGLQAWERGERATRVAGRGVTLNTSYRFLAEHPETREITKESFRLATKIEGFGAKAIAQFIWAFDKISVDDRKDFFEKLSEGTNMPIGHPVLQLLNFLRSEKKSTRRVTDYHRSALLCKAWNLYRDGEETKKLTFRAGGANPEAFPEPQ